MEGEWHRDGPEVRVEFVRKSGNGLLTLVLFDRAEPVRSHWVWIDAVNPGQCSEKLGRAGRSRPKFQPAEYRAMARKERGSEDP